MPTYSEIAALARKHGLSDDAVRELAALWDASGATTLPVLDVPVDLHATTLMDGVRGDVSIDDVPQDDLVDDVEDDRPRIAGRYVDLGLIGVGGMGEIRRVRDLAFHRTLAMKTLHARLADRPVSIARFLEEAQVTAQLQHPGIVPLHDMGTHPDGRIWFTMKEVRGRTLADVVREVHAASAERWEPGSSGWTFRRLVAAFLGTCHAVAYAHERGVVHRDLKPENVMVGAHGEVMVLDWGLAKVVGRASTDDDVLPDESEGAIVSTRSGGTPTRAGSVAGTPAYMPPEQARGENHRLDARADVYALGAILYEILSGRPPYFGSPIDVLGQVLAGPPPPVGRAGRPPLPDDLVAVCERAMGRNPAWRYPSAPALAAEVEAWLDGAKRRDQALEVVARAALLREEADALAARAATLREESAALLADVRPWQPEADKAPGWARAAEADAAAVAAELKQLEVDQTLLGALQISSDLPEAHAALAERYLDRHAAAEAARAPLAKDEALLRAHAGALPEAHPVRKLVATYLKGDGALTLVTDPPGAEVLLYRYVEHNRRLVEVFERSLGTTPLREVTLPMGRYVCFVRHPAREGVRYPIEVRRHGLWDGVPPGERDSRPVWLPRRGELGPDEVYVPAGWFRAGGDPDVPSLPAMRPWCDAFVMHRFPVTNRAYLAFLDDLVARGREEDALRFAARERGGGDGDVGPLIYGYEGGRFFLRPDGDGDEWLPDAPVVNVDLEGAQAYLAWLAERTGRPWRLPRELEWEKAARGVDGRLYPWGDYLDPSWCRVFDTAPSREHEDFGIAVVDSHPVDASPYGVRGMAGNAQDRCVDLFEGAVAVVDGRVVSPDTSPAASRALRVIRGGAWNMATARTARATNRMRADGRLRVPSLSFRGLYRPDGLG